MQGYIPIGNNLYLSLTTGLIHYCKNASEMAMLACLVHPFEMSDKTQRLPAVKVKRERAEQN